MARRRDQNGTWVSSGTSWTLQYRKYDANLSWEWAYETIGSKGEIGKREAERRRRDFMDTVNAANRKPSSRMTLQEFAAKKFEQQVVWKKKPSGQKHYRFYLWKLVWKCQACGRVLPQFKERAGKRSKMCECTPPREHWLGTRRLCDVKVDDVEHLVRELHEQGYSNQSVLHFKNVVSALIRHAKKLGLYNGENPAALVDVPEIRPEKRPTYSEIQVRRAIAALNPQIQAMAILSVETSLGPAEMCGIRRKWVNATSAVVTVDGEVLAPFSVGVRENWYEGQRGSLKEGARCRNVPITPETAEMLAEVTGAAPLQDPEAPLFQSRVGTPIDTHNVANRHFRPLSKSLGFPVTWYAFRRAHSTFVGLLKGVSTEDRQRTMGHADAKMTLYYSVEGVERMRAIPTGIRGLLMGTGKISVQ